MRHRLGFCLATLGAIVAASCRDPGAAPSPSSLAGAPLAGSSSAAGGTANGGASGAGASSGAATNLGGGGTATDPAGGTATSGGTLGGGGQGPAAAGAAGEATVEDDRCSVARYSASAPPQQLALTGDLGTHDPMILATDDQFYLFSTGKNLGAKTSRDLLAWKAAPDVFSAATRPAWLAQQVPGVGDLWAPDASYFGGAYHLYYAASTFGSNHSCIGHLSRESMTSGSWQDRGPIICSNVDSKDDFNAIDPNAFVDTDGTPWLVFGSYWSGIKLIELDSSGARASSSLEALATRPSGAGVIEAPFLVRRCGYYYLFTSWDRCCQGVNSTYNTRVGRATSLHGPYADRSGKALLQGGGSLILEGAGRYRGPGHNAVIFRSSSAYNIYHAYDADNDGASVLRIAELAWDDDGWPISAGP